MEATRPFRIVFRPSPNTGWRLFKAFAEERARNKELKKIRAETKCAGKQCEYVACDPMDHERPDAKRTF